MKLFDEQQLKYWQARRKSCVIVFACVSLPLLCAAILSVVFLENWGRGVSQVVCTVSLAVLLCGVLYFVRLYICFSRFIDICKAANTLSHQIFVGTADVGNGVTTYRFLPFHSVTVHTDDGDKSVYLYGVELKQNVVYSFSVCQRVICSFEELS